MAAITPVAGNPHGSLLVLRNAVAQANTGQTDWVLVPRWAKYMIGCFNLTAVAGTTPTASVGLRTTDPVAKDDTYSIGFAGMNVFTLITGVAHMDIYVGPGITGIADDLTGAGTGNSAVSVNAPLPWLMGFLLTLDRTEANETYTYNLSVEFRA